MMVRELSVQPIQASARPAFYDDRASGFAPPKIWLVRRVSRPNLGEKGTPKIERPPGSIGRTTVLYLK